MGGEANHADLASRAADQGAGFERGTVGRQLEQRGMGARTYDLEEAEAVNCGPLERFGQDRIDRVRRGLSRHLAFDGWQVDPDRAADAMTLDRFRGRPRTRHGQVGDWQV